MTLPARSSSFGIRLVVSLVLLPIRGSCIAALSHDSEASLWQSRTRVKFMAAASPGVSSLPAPGQCTCDDCVSAARVKPTPVSDTKCVPSMDIALGQTCDPKGSFPQEAVDTTIPYQTFCMCGCQPYLKYDSKFSVDGSSPACVVFTPEQKAALMKKGPNCQDPKLPTRFEQSKMAKMTVQEVMKVAQQANTPAPKPAPKKVHEQVKKVWKSHDETVKQANAAALAADSARQLS